MSKINADVDGIILTADSSATLSLATSDVVRATIDSSGNVGIGGTAGASVKVHVLGTLPTSSNSTQGFRMSGEIPSGTTTVARSYLSFPSTAAASFTLTDLYHFEASQGTFGAGSAVANQRGFVVAGSLTGATNNYGFYSNIASGSGRYNFYANGSADNFFEGNVGIGTNTPAARLDVVTDALINGLTVGKGQCSVATNTAFGVNALAANTTGFFNTAIGYSALCSNTIGDTNVAIGRQPLFNNTEGVNNVAIGENALYGNTCGNGNVAVGNSTLLCNTTGCVNVAIGGNALLDNDTGTNNVAIGCSALRGNTTGDHNTGVGNSALRCKTTGDSNAAFGMQALGCVTTGQNNIGIGRCAGFTGASPLAITTASNQVIIGNNSHDCFVAGCAWVTSSDCRDKTDVAPTIYGLDFVRALQPVEYKWDKRSRYGYNEETGEYGTPDGSLKDAHCSIGFLAQQVIALEKQVAPDRKPIIVSEDDPTSLLLSETRLIPALVKAIQELTARVEALENA